VPRPRLLPELLEVEQELALGGGTTLLQPPWGALRLRRMPRQLLLLWLLRVGLLGRLHVLCLRVLLVLLVLLVLSLVCLLWTLRWGHIGSGCTGMRLSRCIRLPRLQSTGRRHIQYKRKEFSASVKSACDTVPCVTRMRSLQESSHASIVQ